MPNAARENAETHAAFDFLPALKGPLRQIRVRRECLREKQENGVS